MGPVEDLVEVAHLARVEVPGALEGRRRRQVDHTAHPTERVFHIQID